MGKAAKRFAIGAIVAAAAGYVTGVLTAPKSGKETRSDIKSAANQKMTEAERQLKKLHTELTTLLNRTKSEASELKGKARQDYDEVVRLSQTVREKAREVLSALHEDGAVEDKDLKKAIDDANKAVEHLKKYIKKQA
jgi:gas vesicle protein